MNWFDVYNPKAGIWTKLPDAPRARDHFQVAITDGKLVAAAGRRSGFDGRTFAAVIKEVDVYDFDFDKGAWMTLPSPEGDVPTPRAGTASLTIGDEYLVISAESGSRKPANSEVEAFDPCKGTWRSLPPLSTGRHESQPILFEGSHASLPADSITRGGTETDSQEVREIRS